MSRETGRDGPAAGGVSRESRTIVTFERGAGWGRVSDSLAVERPLEIHVAGAEPLITMRTPGHDRELAAGLLHGEGVINARDEIVYLRHSPAEPDVVRVMLKPAARARLAGLSRNTLLNSACGVCGKPRFRMPRPAGDAASSAWRVEPEWLLSLPSRLRAGQGVFEATGGIHAAALFEPGGEPVGLREDVGRHNALDKLIGRALLDDMLPLSRTVVMLSGRASFELLQKSVAAGVPMVCAISAPSSFAVAMAERFGVTLIGFLRGNRFNVYAGADRIRGAVTDPNGPG